MSANYLDIAKQLEKEYSKYFSSPITIPETDLYLIIQNTLPQYRLFIFTKFCSLLSKKDYCNVLKYAYTKTSGLNTSKGKLKLDDILLLFKNADKKLLMEVDYKKWLKFSDEVTIYRGTSEKTFHNAISWTIDRKRAIWFYKKYESKGTVFKAKIKKSDIICFLDKSACNEKEVIVDYNKIYCMEELSKEEIDRNINFDCYEFNGNTNNDYVIRATQNLLELLSGVGITPTKELANEIFKSYQQRGKYKSNYILNFISGDKISLSDLLELAESARQNQM